MRTSTNVLIFMVFSTGIMWSACKPEPPKRCFLASEEDAQKKMEEAPMTDLTNKADQAPSKKTAPAPIALPERETIDAKYKWDATVLFASRDAWEQELAAVTELVKDKKLQRFKGKLGGTPKAVVDIMKGMSDLQLRLEKLAFYAQRDADVDLRKSEGREMMERVKSLANLVESDTSYMEPEFIRLGQKKLEALRDAKDLADHRRYFESLIRLQKHVLSGPEEEILSRAGIMGDVSYETYEAFSHADLTFPTVTDAEGNKISLSAAMYGKYRSAMNRADRKKVFEAFWPVFKQFRNTFASLLSSQIKYYSYVAKARNYPDPLTAALFPKNIPTDYYKGLVKGINENLDAFHDFLNLRKKMLKLPDAARYYDIYPPLVTAPPKKYTFEDSKKLILEALAPLGDDYRKLMEDAFREQSGWFDVFPNAGKRSGAYMDSVYGVHPFMLLNHNDDFDSVSTLAHELGHAMHSAYSMKTQPYPKSSYVTFTAEVASVVNETLLIEYMLKKEKDPEARRFLLSHYLDGFRGTVFRQTMFAEFELSAYEAYSSGKVLTADALDEMYLQLLRRYHGHDKGVMDIEDLYAVEWAYIPHFYYNFYVYSYVNGLLAATVLADAIVTGGKPAAEKYINGLLKAGGSKDPLEILKDAGVDMLDPATFKKAVDKFRLRTKELAEYAK
ncbi:MAG: oligoendopeptidase F [Deltaproteobacteria bacterium HGW-Deltaproteobacteria-22]|nr:MAG: oligoendopeptidase F [Deltaproteobacteria bacterium HGW-Deltaproteobacteria-22]